MKNKEMGHWNLEGRSKSDDDVTSTFSHSPLSTLAENEKPQA